MWVTRSMLEKVLMNPFEPTEKIKKSYAGTLFTTIRDKYQEEFKNTIFKNTLPLNYFLDKYVEMTGIDRNKVEQDFLKYIEENKAPEM